MIKGLKAFALDRVRTELKNENINWSYVADVLGVDNIKVLQDEDGDEYAECVEIYGETYDLKQYAGIEKR
jgi:hypothetical protein